MYRLFFLSILLLANLPTLAQQRARDLGLPMEGTPGPLNAITDIDGIEVGFTTLIKGEPGPLVVGQGPVRTGVTAIFPRGKANLDPVFGAWFTLNGNGEMTGTTWVEESGFVEGPIMITNTHSVGIVRDAVIRWMVREGHLQYDFMMPVVAETYDALNDINGQHVREEHAIAAMDSARGGPVAEGNVGGGTGMKCHSFKGGTGTASQLVDGYTVGVLVQCNYGRRSQLRIAGVPVGLEMTEPRLCWDSPEAPERWGIRRCSSGVPTSDVDRGSIIIVLATDAPLLPHQLKRLVKRAALGVGKMGGIGGNSSGDIFIAFSTANPGAADADSTRMVEMRPNETLDPLFQATIWAVEEAIVNAMLGADTMTGADYLRVPALPKDRLVEVMRKFNRLVESE
ncbi:MAG TPA: P1 family peptidase [Rhodothermales bacterium]|nr:P1 family peptidase [Rhodothermales bacterium]